MRDLRERRKKEQEALLEAGTAGVQETGDQGKTGS
jgi:hypothetical protein